MFALALVLLRVLIVETFLNAKSKLTSVMMYYHVF